MIAITIHGKGYCVGIVDGYKLDDISYMNTL